MSNYILIEVEIDEELDKRVKKIGLVLEEDLKKEKKGFGVIKKVGHESKYDSSMIDKKVFFDKWSGDEIEEEDKKFYLVQDDKLLALIA